MVSPTATEERHYIGGSVLVTITGRTASVAGTTKTRYLHKDHLGSITAITDEGGAEVEAFSFDPWGKRRAPTLASLIAKIGSPWTSMSTYQKGNLTLVASALSSTLTNRGFTGHEQLDGVELIHMGGRVYDAEIGRFLSADPFVQDITNLQGLNRYSYVENNPLSYTDPSGFFLKKLFNKVGDALGDALSSIGRAVKKALVKVLRGNLIDTIKIVARYYVCSSIEDSSACAQIVDGVVDVVANSANGGTRDKHDSTSSTGNIQARYESSPWWSRGNRNASSRYILQIQNDSMGGPINDATRPKSPAEAFVDVGHAVAEAKVANGVSPDTPVEPWRIPMPVWASDPDVKREMGRIWNQSRTDLPPTQRYEQGGWVVERWWARDGDVSVIRVLPGLPHKQPWLGYPPRFCFCTVRGVIHSHPLRGKDGPWDPFRPSDADLKHSKSLDILGIIVTFPDKPGGSYQAIPYEGN